MDFGGHGMDVIDVPAQTSEKQLALE